VKRDRKTANGKKKGGWVGKKEGAKGGGRGLRGTTIRDTLTRKKGGEYRSHQLERNKGKGHPRGPGREKARGRGGIF